MERKRFQIRTIGFENRTLIRAVLSAAVLLILSCAGPTGPLPPPSVPSLRSGGLIVATVPGEWEGTQRKLAQELQRVYRSRGWQLEIMNVSAEPPSSQSWEVSPQRASGRLSRAWDAYYRLELAEALDWLSEPADGSWARTEDAEAVVLSALIHYAQGNRGPARARIRHLKGHHPRIRLDTSEFPPRFIDFFSGVIVPTLPQRVARWNGKPLRRSDLRRTAQIHGWREVWGLKMTALGWNGRAELIPFALQQQSRRQPTEVEFVKGSTLDAVASRLVTKNILH